MVDYIFLLPSLLCVFGVSVFFRLFRLFRLVWLFFGSFLALFFNLAISSFFCSFGHEAEALIIAFAHGGAWVVLPCKLGDFERRVTRSQPDMLLSHRGGEGIDIYQHTLSVIPLDTLGCADALKVELYACLDACSSIDMIYHG